MTPAIGKVIRMVDEERLAVAKAYGLALDNFCTVLYNAGSTTKEAADAQRTEETKALLPDFVFPSSFSSVCYSLVCQ